jgi:hypothetical protein
MMAVSAFAALFLVPMGFVLSGPFSAWLRSAGVHAAPNLADGRLIAEQAGFERCGSDVPPLAAGGDAAIENALAIRRFSVRKVAFRPGSGMGIAPRLNLSFEFEGALPDPHESTKGFSLTVLHVYIKTPGATARPVTSTRVAGVDFAGAGWSHQVIIDGLHDQARIFDSEGKLVGRGLGLYVRPEREERGRAAKDEAPIVVRTRLTAALPLALLGDPERGEWAYYALVGVADSTNPSMMRHSGPQGGLGPSAGVLVEGTRPGSSARPRLTPLIVKNPT